MKSIPSVLMRITWILWGIGMLLTGGSRFFPLPFLGSLDLGISVLFLTAAIILLCSFAAGTAVLRNRFLPYYVIGFLLVAGRGVVLIADEVFQSMTEHALYGLEWLPLAGLFFWLFALGWSRFFSKENRSFSWKCLILLPAGVPNLLYFLSAPGTLESIVVLVFTGFVLLSFGVVTFHGTGRRFSLLAGFLLFGVADLLPSMVWQGEILPLSLILAGPAFLSITTGLEVQDD